MVTPVIKQFENFPTTTRRSFESAVLYSLLIRYETCSAAFKPPVITMPHYSSEVKEPSFNFDDLTLVEKARLYWSNNGQTNHMKKAMNPITLHEGL